MYGEPKPVWISASFGYVQDGELWRVAERLRPSHSIHAATMWFTWPDGYKSAAKARMAAVLTARGYGEDPEEL